MIFELLFQKDEDIKLNSTVFFWPELVMQILEKNQVRLQALREKTEDKLRERLAKYDDKLKDMYKRVEAYKTIGVCISIQNTLWTNLPLIKALTQKKFSFY